MIQKIKNRFKKVNLFALAMALEAFFWFYLSNQKLFEPYDTMLIKVIVSLSSIVVIVGLAKIILIKFEKNNLKKPLNFAMGIILVFIFKFMVGNFPNPSTNYFFLPFFMSGIYYLVKGIGELAPMIYCLAKEKKTKESFEIIASMIGLLSVPSAVSNIIKALLN